MILHQRLVKVDGKVRTDHTFPAGFMDVVDIEKTDEHFRLLFDTKGRFVAHRISPEEASYKLCRVRKLQYGKRAIPYLVTHDGRTIRFPDPDIKVFTSTHILFSSPCFLFLASLLLQTVLIISCSDQRCLPCCQIRCMVSIANGATFTTLLFELNLVGAIRHQ